MLGNLPGGKQQPTEYFCVVSTRFTDARDNLFRHDQDMDRRLRVYVVEGDQIGVFMHNLRWNLPVNYLLEDCH